MRNFEGRIYVLTRLVAAYHWDGQHIATSDGDSVDGEMFPSSRTGCDWLARRARGFSVSDVASSPPRACGRAGRAPPGRAVASRLLTSYWISRRKPKCTFCVPKYIRAIRNSEIDTFTLLRPKFYYDESFDVRS